jgi:transposase
LVRRADGYYAQFAIDVNVKFEPQPTNQVVGIDLGLKYFIADDKGNVEPEPQFYRKSQKQLNRANRKKSHKYDPKKRTQYRVPHGNLRLGATALGGVPLLLHVAWEICPLGRLV